ncbi:hypothetical protein [Natronococcus roseus]|uniref:hypothetical protein n=1 Tax=Natronococcus roseus TaxID=1052014 RepID=UPI00374DC17D
MPTNDESGMRRTGVYWAREETDDFGNPVTPDDPDFFRYSTVVEGLSMAPDANFEERSGLGNAAGVDKNRMQEVHELSITYDVERFFVNSDGDVRDAFADAAQRTIDNNLASTHSYLEVEKKETIVPTSTWHSYYFEALENDAPDGVDPEDPSSRATRIVGYGRGCYPEEATLTIDPEESAVLQVELEYRARKSRRYQFDQPDGEYIHVRSTDSDDEGPVDLETVDGDQNEQLGIDGEEFTTSSSEFDSLRVHLPEDLDGDLEVYAGDSDGPEELLTVIRGAESYDGIEGDRGVPLLGDGELGPEEDDLGEGLTSLGTGATYMGHPVGQHMDSTTITVTNEIEENGTDEGLAMALNPSELEIVATPTVFGETESPEKVDQHMIGEEGALRWSVGGGDVEIPRAYCQNPGETEKEEGEAVMQLETEYKALQPDEGDLLQFTPA